MDEVKYFLEWCKTNGITPMKHNGFNSYIPLEWQTNVQERRVSGCQWSIDKLLQYYSDENA